MYEVGTSGVLDDLWEARKEILPEELWKWQPGKDLEASARERIKESELRKYKNKMGDLDIGDQLALVPPVAWAGILGLLILMKR